MHLYQEIYGRDMHYNISTIGDRYHRSKSRTHTEYRMHILEQQQDTATSSSLNQQHDGPVRLPRCSVCVRD